MVVRGLSRSGGCHMVQSKSKHSQLCDYRTYLLEIYDIVERERGKVSY